MTFTPIMTFLKGLGSSIVNVYNANILLKGIELEHCFDSMPGITNKMTIKYKNDIMP